MILSFVLGFLWGTLLEWGLHKYVLHDLAKKKAFKFHLDHHRISSKEGGLDHEYEMPFWSKASRMKEPLGLIGLVALHAPVLLFSVPLFLGCAVFAAAFYVVHVKSHRDLAWGWRWVPWHMSHHLTSAKKNYGIVIPIWDWVFNTLNWK